MSDTTITPEEQPTVTCSSSAHMEQAPGWRRKGVGMSRDFNTNTANHDEWLTPPDILAALGPAEPSLFMRR